MKNAVLTLLLAAVPLAAQAPQHAPDPFQPLAFLTGNWDAKGAGPGGATATGYYTFQTELNGHVLARRSYTADCHGPEDYDCKHGDLLYVYRDAAGGDLRAIYFDSEGHVIHYAVTTPEPQTAVFLSDASAPGPLFRLVYQRKDLVLSGKFQMRMPGEQEWHSYLEWSGAKR
ncbi:MAG: hypothetical protein ACLQHF_06670 [Terracidiphilus sp.]